MICVKEIHAEMAERVVKHLTNLDLNAVAKEQVFTVKDVSMVCTYQF